MSVSALVCLAPGSEETEAVTAIDLMTRAGINVTTASVTPNGEQLITCSRGVKLMTETTLLKVADVSYDVIVLPGGNQGAEALSQSALLIEKIRQMHQEGKLIAAICAAPALVLAKHQLFPEANMTSYPSSSLKKYITDGHWLDKRVYYDERFRLLTSQGPATSIDFTLKIIQLLINDQKAAEVAEQLILPPGIYNYQNKE